MTLLDGFRLEFDDGTVFRARENVVIDHNPSPNYFMDGFSNFAAIHNEWIQSGGQPGRADSNFGAIFFGFGAGVHIIRLTFVGGWEDSTDTWWDSNAGDSALSKLQTLNRALTTKRMDSFGPGLLQIGEYNPNGKYDAIPVALGDGNGLTFDPEQHTTIFDGQLELWECLDLTQPVSASARDRG